MVKIKAPEAEISLQLLTIFIMELNGIFVQTLTALYQELSGLFYDFGTLQTIFQSDFKTVNLWYIFLDLPHFTKV